MFPGHPCLPCPACFSVLLRSIRFRALGLPVMFSPFSLFAESLSERRSGGIDVSSSWRHVGVSAGLYASVMEPLTDLGAAVLNAAPRIHKSAAHASVARLGELLPPPGAPLSSEGPWPATPGLTGSPGSLSSIATVPLHGVPPSTGPMYSVVEITRSPCRWFVCRYR